MTDYEHGKKVGFVRGMVEGWLQNLMRDAANANCPIEPEAVCEALLEVAEVYNTLVFDNDFESGIKNILEGGNNG